LLGRQILAGLTVANLLDRAARVWRQSSKREPERGAERVNVRARIDRLLNCSGSRNSVCHEFSVCQVRFSSGIRDRFGKTEVDDFHVEFRRIVAGAAGYCRVSGRRIKPRTAAAINARDLIATSSACPAAFSARDPPAVRSTSRMA
jgi:hypothetical protein